MADYQLIKTNLAIEKLIEHQKKNKTPYYFDIEFLYHIHKESLRSLAIIDKNNCIRAFFLYIKKKRFLFSIYTQPPFTQNFGYHYIYNSTISKKKNFDYETRFLRMFLNDINDYDYFSINTKNKNNLPFKWQGFEEYVKYNYEINLDKDLDEIFLNLESSIRGKIRKAESIIKIEINQGPLDFFNVYVKSFRRQNKKTPLNRNLFLKIDKYLEKKNMRTILLAKDHNNFTHSGLYLIHDEDNGYINMMGDDPDLRQSGASIKLIWEAIKICKTKTLKKIDFQGSELERLEKIRRYFGATQTKYYSLKKANNILTKIFIFLRSIQRSYF